MTLTSLSGLLNITFLLRSNFELGQTNIPETSDFHLMDMGYVVAAINVLAPLFTCIFVLKIGQKRFMLLSAGLMASALLFITLLAHFQDQRLLRFIANSPAFGWTVQTAIVAFLIGHQVGAGPLSWLLAAQLMPAKAIEVGLALSAAVWWAFNLVFSLTLSSLVTAIGLSGLCAIHAVIGGLMYGFVLLIVPDVRKNSLQEIEDFYRIITNTPLDSRFRFSFRSNTDAGSMTN